MSIHGACDDGGGGWDGARAAMAVRLVEAEVLPQTGRWHRRDLAPALDGEFRRSDPSLTEEPGGGAAPGAAAAAEGRRRGARQGCGHHPAARDTSRLTLGPRHRSSRP